MIYINVLRNVYTSIYLIVQVVLKTLRIMIYKITLIRLDYANYKQSVSCNLQNYNNY